MCMCNCACTSATGPEGAPVRASVTPSQRQAHVIVNSAAENRCIIKALGRGCLLRSRR